MTQSHINYEVISLADQGAIANDLDICQTATKNDSRQKKSGLRRKRFTGIMSNRSPSFHVWSFLLGCIWSLAFGSAFRLGLFSFRKHSVSTRVESGTTSTTMFSPSVLSLSRRSISSSSSSSLSPSPSPVMMEAVPSGRKRRKFQQVRKRIFSRTRRGYRNDGDGIVILVDEDVSSEPETPMSTETVDEENSDKAMRKAEIGARIRAIREETQGQHQQLTRKRPRYTPYLPSLAGKKKPKPLQVETVEELRHAILDQQLRLSDTTIVEAKSQSNVDAAQTTAGKGVPPVLDHAVRDLIKERFVNGTTPGHRLPEDKATLALAIEGGGMRGCVSAGMVAALTALGLSDTVDSIYGSSAGSVVGAYMVSRQVCLDVYVDILPASKKLFVCKKRMVANLASLGLTQMLGKRNSRKTGNGEQKIDFISSSTLSPPSPLPKTLRERLLQTQPGMNISFVLDGIMGDDHGLRPLDVQAFRENSEKQKLRVVSSCVDPATGKLLSKCFGSKEFFCKDESLTSPDRKRQGLFACLQASMTVPGATGPPINLVRKNEASEDPLPCFDAFCFEPIPYRSAVEEGATHVLVLTTRPEDFVPLTQPTVYESGVAPLYFHSHGQKGVAEFFEKGGQQYIYAEDLMLLQEARHKGSEGILVPPPEILYGVPRTNEISKNIRDRDNSWNKAHLFPLRVPKGYKELEALSQDKDEVLEAVRDGFMTAFDSLKDIVGLENLEGSKVAEMLFPSSGDDEIKTEETGKLSSLSPVEEEILRTKVNVPGAPIPESRLAMNKESLKLSRGIFRRPRSIFRRGGAGGLFGHGRHDEAEGNGIEEKHEMHQWREEEFSATTLLECLPGFQDGKYSHLAKGLIEEQQRRTTI